jgi:hypothetical protein
MASLAVVVITVQVRSHAPGSSRSFAGSRQNS